MSTDVTTRYGMEDVAHNVKKCYLQVSHFDKVEVTVGNSTQKKRSAS